MRLGIVRHGGEWFNTVITVDRNGREYARDRNSNMAFIEGAFHEDDLSRYEGLDTDILVEKIERRTGIHLTDNEVKVLLGA